MVERFFRSRKEECVWAQSFSSFSEAGYQVETASSGIEGLEMAREIRPAFITLDAVMPGMDGWAVLSELKGDSDLSDIPVIMVSVMNEKRMGFTLGAPEFVTKPIDWKRLQGLIEKYRRPEESYTLVVEDDTDTRDVLIRHLEGYVAHHLTGVIGPLHGAKLLEL